MTERSVSPANPTEGCLCKKERLTTCPKLAAEPQRRRGQSRPSWFPFWGFCYELFLALGGGEGGVFWVTLGSEITGEINAT